MGQEYGVDLGTYTLEQLVRVYYNNGCSLERMSRQVPFSRSTLSRLFNAEAPDMLRGPGRPPVDEETINKIAELANLGEATIKELACAHGTSESTYYRYQKNRAR